MDNLNPQLNPNYEQQHGNPQPGYPLPSYSQPGYPQPGNPQPGYPQPGYPQPGYPATTLLNQAGEPTKQPDNPGGYPAGSPTNQQGNPGGNTAASPSKQAGFQPGYPADYPAGTPTKQAGYPAPLPAYSGVYPAPPAYPGGVPLQGAYAVGINDGSNPLEAGLIGDDADVKFFDFNDQSIRRNFIKKVYGILSCMLLFTLAVITFFIFCEPVKHFVKHNKPVMWSSLGIYIATVLVLVCVTEARRKAPLNYILLLVFTGATSYLLGAVSATAEVGEVMLAVGITAIICFSLTLFAFQTKYDFTRCSGFILCAIMALLFLSIGCAIWPGRAAHIACAALGVLIFSFSLVHNTQLMMGGKHKYAITPEEYVFAALTLYLDIINIFIRVLRLVR